MVAKEDLQRHQEVAASDQNYLWYMVSKKKYKMWNGKKRQRGGKNTKEKETYERNGRENERERQRRECMIA